MGIRNHASIFKYLEQKRGIPICLYLSRFATSKLSTIKTPVKGVCDKRPNNVINSHIHVINGKFRILSLVKKTKALISNILTKNKDQKIYRPLVVLEFRFEIDAVKYLQLDNLLLKFQDQMGF